MRSRKLDGVELTIRLEINRFPVRGIKGTSYQVRHKRPFPCTKGQGYPDIGGDVSKGQRPRHSEHQSNPFLRILLLSQLPTCVAATTRSLFTTSFSTSSVDRQQNAITTHRVAPNPMLVRQVGGGSTGGLANTRRSMILKHRASSFLHGAELHDDDQGRGIAGQQRRKQGLLLVQREVVARRRMVPCSTFSVRLRCSLASFAYHCPSTR